MLFASSAHGAFRDFRSPVFDWFCRFSGALRRIADFSALRLFKLPLFAYLFLSRFASYAAAAWHVLAVRAGALLGVAATLRRRARGRASL